MHDLSLITTIAAAFTVAWVLGLATQRLHLSPIVGYLLAGVLIGPYTPGFVGNVQIAQQLAEVGVILLMFGVGLHFRLEDLLAVKGVAIPGALIQSVLGTLLAIAVFPKFGLSVATSAVLGMAMAVASTVVLTRVLIDAEALDSPQGHVAVGWLIVEDIITVVLLVLIPVLGDRGAAGAADAAPPDLWVVIAVALFKLVALVAIVAAAGSRLVPRTLLHVARLRSRELFTLTILVFSIAVAAASYLFFGASMALGAFLAGMVVSRSPVSHQAAADALPMRDAFAVLFFVSVGMLFDPTYLLREPLLVLAALAMIVIAKPLLKLAVVTGLGYSVRTGLTVALGLAQIGEFSFILADLSRSHGLMPESGVHLLVAAAILSITLNPLLFRSLPALESWLRGRPLLWRILNHRTERRAAAINAAAVAALRNAAVSDKRLAIVIGYGPVGRAVHRLLDGAGMDTVVVDLNVDTVAALHAAGQAAIFGDAAHESILEQAGIRRATHLVVTLPHSHDLLAVLAAARGANPKVRTLVRARYLQERESLERFGVSAAVFEEAEAAVALARLVLADTGAQRAAAESRIRDLRLQLLTENIANIRSQHVRSVMVPWTRVRRLSRSASRDKVLELIAEEHFSRWPVTEPPSGRATGYLLAKDLIARATDADWTRLVRPLQAISPDESIESVLARMQGESTSLYVVEEEGRPLGLVTFEDIVEQVVGRIEDEYPREAPVSLANALAAGGILLELRATTREEAIREMVAVIAGNRLPSDLERDEVVRLVLAREAEMSTDLGIGVAVPHARCPGLASPVAVFGRSSEGILFSPQAEEPARLLFLVLTPGEEPEVQLALLSQLANLVRSADVRDSLRRIESPADAMAIVR